jgi:hypothetical protein
MAEPSIMKTISILEEKVNINIKINIRDKNSTIVTADVQEQGLWGPSEGILA